MPGSTERMLKNMPLKTSTQTSNELSGNDCAAGQNSCEPGVNEPVAGKPPELKPGAKPSASPMSEILAHCLKPKKKNDPGIPH